MADFPGVPVRPKEGAHRRAPAAAVGAGSPAARALLKTIKGAFDRRRPCPQAQEPAGTCAGAPERASITRLRSNAHGARSAAARNLVQRSRCAFSDPSLARWVSRSCGPATVKSAATFPGLHVHSTRSPLVYDTCDTGVSHQ